MSQMEGAGDFHFCALTLSVCEQRPYGQKIETAARTGGYPQVA
jgi:hypothetical protein